MIIRHNTRKLADVLVVGFVIMMLTSQGFAENSAGLTPGEHDKEKIDKMLGKQPYSPYADRKFPSRPLFGQRLANEGELSARVLLCGLLIERGRVPWRTPRRKGRCRCK